MSDIALESSPAALTSREHVRKSIIATSMFNLTAGVALRLLMLRVVIRLARTPPGGLH